MKATLMKLNFSSGLLAAVLLVSLLASCGGSKTPKNAQGQLIGVSPRPKYFPPVPYGMVYVPSGTFHMGPSDEDLNYAYTARNKSISISGFYMDATEITNNEYRQFVLWVTDSIAHIMLGHVKNDGGEDYIDWKKKINYRDKSTMDQLESMTYAPEDRLYGRKEFDVRKLVYHAETFNWEQAKKRENANVSRAKFIVKKDVAIYPDTLCWIRDFSYAYNEPMTRMYFWHPAFDNYPVVGVTWHQANAFAEWRSKFWEDYRISKKLFTEDKFQLPSEAQWEYAARGGREQTPYPWGGYYIRNKKGCLLANFKPGRGNYPEDGGFYTVRADAYWPNDYGLYNMSGNVAEWTQDIYYENAYSFTSDMNPYLRMDVPDNAVPKMKRKAVRGGSWKDIGYFLQTGTRSYEYQDSAKSYIGFRCTIAFLSRSKNDFGHR
jgi:gliding motility-associated lipoprotein GldK